MLFSISRMLFVNLNEPIGIRVLWYDEVTPCLGPLILKWQIESFIFKQTNKNKELVHFNKVEGFGLSFERRRGHMVQH